MSRSLQPPTYLKGKKRPDGGYYARTIVNGREKPLGVYGSPESHAELDRLRAEWRAAQAAGRAHLLGRDCTVDDLAAAWYRHIEDEGLYVLPDGTSTTERRSWPLSLGPLLRLYGSTSVREFGPLALKAVRQAMIDGSWLTPEEREERQAEARELIWCRKTINQRVRRIVRMFGFGVSEQLVPVEVHQALQAVDPLPASSKKTHDYPEVGPVPIGHVARTLRQLKNRPVIRAMVLVQLLTGMRPGELCAMRIEDIDRKGLTVEGVRVWVHRPGGGDRHKTAHHGIKRAIALGRHAQRFLAPFIDGKTEGYVFSPREAQRLRYLRMRAERKTPVQPSQQDRSKAEPGRQPGPRYQTTSYAQAILAAARSAGVPDWSPNQLRKLAATTTEDRLDLDTARAQLGHTTAQTTKRHYAKADLKKAAKAAAKHG